MNRVVARSSPCTSIKYVAFNVLRRNQGGARQNEPAVWSVRDRQGRNFREGSKAMGPASQKIRWPNLGPKMSKFQAWFLNVFGTARGIVSRLCGVKHYP